MADEKESIKSSGDHSGGMGPKNPGQNDRLSSATGPGGTEKKFQGFFVKQLSPQRSYHCRE